MSAELPLLLLGGSLLVLVAVTSVRLATRTGLPSLLLFLAIGLAIGESGAGIRFDDAAFAHEAGFLALVVILADGGLTTRWTGLRPALPAALSLSMVGVAVSVGITGTAAHLLLGLPWRTALLLGAVLAPTDAAAVFATLRGAPLRPRIARVLEAESGTNDPLAVLLVVGLSGTAWSGRPGWLIAADLVYQLVAGGLIGLAVGRVAVVYLGRSALPAAGLYPLAALSFAVLGYAAADTAGASGFLAVYVLCVVVGNAELPHRVAVLAFADGLAWLAQIALFVLLGLLASPGRLPAAVLPALAIGLVLTVVARPVSVWLSTALLRFSWREQAMLSWAGLRGAVPIVLATEPITAGVKGSDRLFDLVFVLVVVLTAVQAPTLRRAARRLRVDDADTPYDLRIEAAPLERLRADLVQVAIGPDSRLHGAYVYELRLPPTSVVSLLVRDGRSVVPDADTRLRGGDELLVVVPAADREAVERRLRAVSRQGALATWLGETGQA